MKLVRADPEKDDTHGFFVARFDRKVKAPSAQSADADKSKAAEANTKPGADGKGKRKRKRRRKKKRKAGGGRPTGTSAAGGAPPPPASVANSKTDVDTDKRPAPPRKKRKITKKSLPRGAAVPEGATRDTWEPDWQADWDEKRRANPDDVNLAEDRRAAPKAIALALAESLAAKVESQGARQLERSQAKREARAGKILTNRKRAKMKRERIKGKKQEFRQKRLAKHEEAQQTKTKAAARRSRVRFAVPGE